ncbi:hypothetical protein Caci_8851 [Catenulispora acidiphila DSM 44928]|uniref:Uncharacterized protein n=1 Tax=Catenulispora acidiphila (strain DSM 44928 / JCM 14897 / NBRC 102108 / NRRL B-24433 / ID139908) TaxID=479433 RepID=C7Q3Q6_CATAD|nr:hypothetical protein [Catenulispora acidiphila]ACU77664.1 hypothetical protein Caci_8851 [Catenulispora acidiphila DSM 44928]
MNAVNASAGEDAVRGLMETAFTAGEPALPDVDDVMATVELLGGHIRHRQRVRTRVAAAMLCLAGFGIVAGIAAVAHSTNTSVTNVVPGGGSGGPPPPPASLTTVGGSAQSSGTSGGTTSVDP